MKYRLTRKYFSYRPLLILLLIGVLTSSIDVPRAVAATACTYKATSIATAQSDVSNAADGAVVCIEPGSYGLLTLTRSGTGHTANVIVEPDPYDAAGNVLDPNGAGKVTLNGVNIEGSYLTVYNFYSTEAIRVSGFSPFPAFTHITIDHNSVGPTHGYGISIENVPDNPSSFITISNNRIHDTSPTTEGDAIRIDGWHDVTVTGNEIYNIKECPGNTCHTDTLQSYQGADNGTRDVATYNLVISKNYIHDTTNAQGFPFLKDGDIANVTITDNLSLRMPTTGTISGFWIDENITGLKIANNTYQGTTGSTLKNDGTASASAQIDHNVLDQFNTNKGAGPAYAMTEGYNMYTGNNQWSFTLGTGSTLNSSPVFMDPAHDDYRLKTNPNNIGVDWSPASQHYGPVATVESSGTPTTPSTLKGDLDGDGHVNQADVDVLTSKWGTAAVAEDLNGNGSVDIGDLSVLLSNWKP